MSVLSQPAIEYPCSDGKPTADNTLQYQWITTIKGGMEVVFEKDANVFVAGDLLWYPVEGQPRISAAPDVMVVLGRPKGHRPSYRQWEEDNIPPQVVFEILSHNNTVREMNDKLDFYDRHQVEEYYLYDPDENTLQGWIRNGPGLRRIPNIEQGWTSPRLNVRFDLQEELILTGPDGRRFLTYEELNQRAVLAEQQLEQRQIQLEQTRKRAEQAEKRNEEMEKELEQLRTLLRQQNRDESHGLS